MTPARNSIISVYRTKITVKNRCCKTILNNCSQVLKWNMDLEDCNNILRIESKESIEQKVIDAIALVSI
tara:strand:- start:324 stop:530 length:207 start_codon:yes stop_codon:yes gene_type:complete